MRRRRKPRQMPLPFPERAERRPGGGRKRRPENVGLQPHAGRPVFDPAVPVHITMRAVPRAPYFRSERAATVVFREIRRATAKGFRIVHFSIQSNHLHLIAEADEGSALSRGIQRLASRLALGLNALYGRRGSLWRERYHRRDLASPRQFRNALVYVVFNFRKHSSGAERARRMRVLDGHSSALWLDAWALPDDDPLLARLQSARIGPSLVAEPQTWIAECGWRRHGLLKPTEMPLAPS